MPEWVMLLAGYILTGGTIGLIQFFITRKDKRNDDLTDIKTKLEKNERDSVRTQLMILLKLYPENIHEIMKCAEHYFEELKGDWYMTGLFNFWLKNNQVAEPEWFNPNN